jgi:molybdopterin/thiamine biosynthesis adenylyltransferase
VSSKISKENRWLIRPSVSLIPLGEDVVEFFQSSTRRSSRFRLKSDIASVITRLNGENEIDDLCSIFGASSEQVTQFLEVLHERCLIEPARIREMIDTNDFHRVLNFIGDYIPADELFSAFERLRSVRVTLLGCGAVGSWTAIQLAHSGIQDFSIIDSDTVDLSNLNRSLFTRADAGLPKVQALASALARISPNISVRQFRQKISSPSHLHDVLDTSGPEIIINCADEPSVDATSGWINDFCLVTGVPYVIAGGYNLHLSLIGMTVIPKLSACFACSRITLEELDDDTLRGVRRLWRPKRNLGSLAPLTGITSALAASETIRLAIQSERMRPAMLNRRGEFNFLTGKISFVDLPKRAECRCSA